MLLGKVPLPTDALAGAYYPWAGQNWGFVAGIPFKNISLTDVFSQLYPWRELAMDLIRTGQLPLWNSFSFSGYPLLANWQSAPFYPLNILMLIFGNIRGYGLMVFAQPLLAGSFMYLFLRQIKLTKVAAVSGAIVSAYSGFVMTYLEYATVGQILAWLPLILYLFEKYFQKRQIRFLALSGLSLFPVLTGGFFQPAFYVLLIASLYFISRKISDKNPNKKLPLFLGLVFISVGTATAAVQLIPTAELLGLSIRTLDHNIIEYHYGLLPFKNLISFLAPDFFGNPVTGNFWGAIQYQEATGYFSAIALILALTVIFSRKKDWKKILFSSLFALSLILAFDNPISRLIYQFGLPLLSTGYASRWLIVTAFSGAFLSAMALEELNRKKIALFLLFGVGTLVVVGFLIWAAIIPLKFALIPVAIRNLILPLVFMEAALFIVLFIKNRAWATWLLLALIVIDLGRFGIKFTPFSSPEYTTRKLSVWEFVKKEGGLNRLVGETGPLLPANSWLYPRLYSPTGYDPLLIKDYAVFFRGVNIGQNEDQEVNGDLGKGYFTRYLNLSNLDSPFVDLLGVKYLLALKMDAGKIRPWGKINESKIDLGRYNPVFDDGTTVVLENKTTLPRAMLYYSAETETDTAKAVEKMVAGFDFRKKLIVDKENPREYPIGKSDTAQITNYSANKVAMETKTENGAFLVLTDTFYPGWEVRVNGEKKELSRAFGVFRAVEVGSGESVVEMVYKPLSFRLGLAISILSLTILMFFATKKIDYGGDDSSFFGNKHYKIF